MIKLKNNYSNPDKEFTDKSSGLNDNRRGLNSLIKYVKTTHDPKTLYITNKDRLTRFGYNYLKELFDSHNTNIVCLNDEETKEPHEILMQDFMSLIASFSGKFYRSRGWEQQKQLLNKATREMETHE